jgi:hypothetical protein
MLTYTLTRTGQTPLTFKGEKIACVYGHWHYGIHWSTYHNLAVYRTEEGQYVVSIQYRTSQGDHLRAQRPHDHAAMVGDTDALTEQLAGYDPLAYPPHDGHDPNYLKSRCWEEVRTILRLLQRVQEGERPPLYEPVVIEWGEIDDDVRDACASAGAEEGISGHEWLRRSEERTMEEIGEGGAPVVVMGADAPDGDEEIGTIFAPSAPGCADCGAQHLSGFFTAPQLGILLCQPCYEARQSRGAICTNCST